MNVSEIPEILIGGRLCYFEAFHSVRPCNHSLFELNAHNMLNTYIYHQLPPISFCVCYTIFRETICQKLQAFSMLFVDISKKGSLFYYGDDET
jgi:hypothetical protein